MFLSFDEHKRRFHRMLLMVTIDFHIIFSLVWKSMATVWLPTFLNISSFVFDKRKKCGNTLKGAVHLKKTNFC